MFSNIPGFILKCCLLIYVTNDVASFIRVSGMLEKDVIGTTFSCKNPCVITYNPGGNVYRFNVAALAARQGERDISVIDGECDSGCAVFADFARPHVCITKRAKFGFHKGLLRVPLFWVTFYKRFDQPQSDDIDAWVRKNGDYPKDGVNYMLAEDAAQFWPLCELHPPLPKPRPQKASAK